MTAGTRALVLFAFAFGLVMNAAAVDPATALADAKKRIASKQFKDAVSLLTPAIDVAAAITDAAQQEQALTALHFYAAVAQSGLGNEEEALTHLAEALRLSPNMRNIDASRYDREFVVLFGRARDDRAGSGQFDELYPGLAATVPASKDDAVSALWESPALEILGSRQERREWKDAISPAARAAFMEEFWARRDDTPGTPENTFRDRFERRIAFADTAFESSGQRGGLSDRGRVLAVLGPPALVRRRALDRQDAANLSAISRGGMGIPVGTVEYWIYTRDQLPIEHGAATVTFRFVTHQGIGDFVLQKDGVPMNVLATAANQQRD